MSYKGDYEWSLRESQEPWVRELYERRYGSKIKTQEIVEGDKRQYNYDKRIIFENGTEILVEEKFRRGPTPDLLVESHHIHPDGRPPQPGWLQKSKADILLYASATAQSGSLIDMVELRRFMASRDFNKLLERGEIKEKRAPNPEYVTHNYTIPWAIVEDHNLSFNPARERRPHMRLDVY
jgi:hypothetical protein